MSAQNPGISITQMAVNGPNVLMCSHPSWHPAYLGPHPCSVTGPVMTTASLATFCTEKVRMSPPAVYSGPFCLLRRCPQSSGHLGTHPNMPVCVFVSFRPYIVLEFPPVSSLYCVGRSRREDLRGLCLVGLNSEWQRESSPHSERTHRKVLTGAAEIRRFLPGVVFFLLAYREV